MRAGERKRGLAVVKLSAGPGAGAVADRTVGGESRCRMIGIRGCLIVLVVARIAVGGRAGKAAANVALRTSNVHVRSGQREPGVAVIESRGQP